LEGLRPADGSEVAVDSFGDGYLIGAGDDERTLRLVVGDAGRRETEIPGNAVETFGGGRCEPADEAAGGIGR